jgi:hypothetical protein
MHQLVSGLAARLRRLHAEHQMFSYGILLALVAIAVILGMIFFGPIVSQIYIDSDCLQCT